MSTISVDSIKDRNGGNTAQINAMTPTADSLQGFRNRIINGDMRIDQRNAGASVTITNTADVTYTLDRWFGFGTAASKFSVQQNAGSVTPPAGFSNYIGVTSLSAYSVLTGDSFSIGQAIEGLNVADLDWGTANAKTVTLSFWVRSSLTGTFGGTIRNSAVNRSYPFTYTISSANTWEQKSITIAGDTSGTWLTTNGVGIRVGFGLGQGSTFSGTAGAWAGANYNNATGATSVVGTNGATFYLTGVQLEVGSVATPFERRPYGTELALCQRYCRVYGASTTLCTALSYTTTQTSGTLMFGQTMRASPTITASSATGFQTTNGGGSAITSTAVGVFLTTADSTEIQITVASGLTAGQAALNRTDTGTLTISAEL